MFIKRKRLLSTIEGEFKTHPICALLGSRQTGKTTLAKDIMTNTELDTHFFDCENPFHLAKLENPMLAMQDLKGLIIIDEVQRRVDLFPILRVIIDEDPEKRILITGSASRDLLQQSSETLAGRIGYHNIDPFVVDEVSNWKKLWKQGGYPKSYLAQSQSSSMRWRDEYIRTFIERDILQLGFNLSSSKINQVLRVLSHLHGNILNIAELSKSLCMDQRTIKRYIAILEGAFMIQVVKPWHSNLKKREVKANKIYFRDTGILHRLLLCHNDDIVNHPKLGFSFEGFVIVQLVNLLQITSQDIYFWSIHNGSELDLLIFYKGKKIGFEMKYMDFPKITKSMRIAMDALSLDYLFVIFPGNEEFNMEKKIHCLGINLLSNIVKIIDSLNWL